MVLDDLRNLKVQVERSQYMWEVHQLQLQIGKCRRNDDRWYLHWCVMDEADIQISLRSKFVKFYFEKKIQVAKTQHHTLNMIK